MVTIMDSDCGVQSLAPEKPARSHAAERLRRSADGVFRLSRNVAVGCLVLAGLHSLLSSEQLAYRIVSLIFLGVLPALAVHLAGHFAFRVLVVASAVHDPVAAWLGRCARVARAIAIALRDGYGRPAVASVRRLATPLALRIGCAGRRVVDAGSAAIIGMLPSRRNAIRAATCPIRLFAHGLLWLQSAAAAHRPV
ncbi:hypothetical protein JQ557_15755 [Bradyrhizobium sp. U87765 SZCCT0131]|uniref:hypothetical protein n=1 Tax=unclassified Bradyrhizobium TaxID=2631580 RepID=UPI001BAA9161|nr:MULTISPECIES: hypothetical protein [unclassified Bradyrhizobium]MBR1219459.1 hypothetical protein [Bradyrhizobium sp. U87765 SZCCT0131]MBR1262110.1 hypothetical protein [Bradyrhizobium sp. U87765 SZCCT0134]MBR1306037.1 hypothetical protein [Bradyrhizobium sp. U87765 SZCCT0110]MBR1317892.1 hypothetical protein [Bradyrhizobium sp. U87765 SZCCT0109]MBR1351594.1 hypothetical protein [Bradyrhizobium sp. U87765 SZCCT0048]